MDLVSKAGQTAWVQFYPYLSNPFAQDLPEFVDGPHGFQQRYKIDRDGRFRLVGIPGKAIVGAQLWNMPFPRGQGSEQIDGRNQNGYFLTHGLGSPPSAKNPTVMKEVDISEGTLELRVDFEVERGRTIKTTVMAPEGWFWGSWQRRALE